MNALKEDTITILYDRSMNARFDIQYYSSTQGSIVTCRTCPRAVTSQVQGVIKQVLTLSGVLLYGLLLFVIWPAVNAVVWTRSILSQPLELSVRLPEAFLSTCCSG